MEFVYKLKLRDYTARQAVIATIIASLFTAVCAQIHFYLPNNPVPITMQVFAVIVCAYLLGSKLAFISQVQYIIAGMIGLPVFAGFKAGAIWLLGPTGGYLVAFALAAYVVGKIIENRENTVKVGYIAGLFGVAVIYIFGSAWLALWMSFSGSSKISMAYLMGVLPFIGVDLLKVFLASNLCFGRR